MSYMQCKLNCNIYMLEQNKIFFYQDSFEDNVTFYAHIKYHIEGITANKSKLDLICPYCTKYFENFTQLNKHKIDVKFFLFVLKKYFSLCILRFI